MDGNQALFCAECRKDNKWHHVAVTWSRDTGKTEVFFDGIFHVPTWRTSEGQWQPKAAKDGGVDPHMAPQTLRLGNGTSASPNNKDACGNGYNMPWTLTRSCLIGL